MTQHIETFLAVNAGEIQAPDRAKIREAAVKAIQGADIDLSACPEHLRDALRRIINQEAYKYRNYGKRFDPDRDYMPTGGQPSPTKIVGNVRI